MQEPKYDYLQGQGSEAGDVTSIAEASLGIVATVEQHVRKSSAWSPSCGGAHRVQFGGLAGFPSGSARKLGLKPSEGGTLYLYQDQGALCSGLDGVGMDRACQMMQELSSCWLRKIVEVSEFALQACPAGEAVEKAWRPSTSVAKPHQSDARYVLLAARC